MNRIFKYCLPGIFALINSKVFAQFHTSGISAGMTWYNYSWERLNNRNNISGKAGQAVYFTCNKGFYRSWSANATMLLGRINDLSNLSTPYANTEFAELNLGVQTCLFKTCEKPSFLVPNLVFGYAFQSYFSSEIPEFSRLQTAVYTGLCCDIRLSDKLRLNTGLSSNQKLNNDFRTYLKFNLGALVRL